jgi:hypothetical protein
MDRSALVHLTDRCRFLNCSVRMGGGGLKEVEVEGENKRGGGRGVGGEVHYES